MCEMGIMSREELSEMGKGDLANEGWDRGEGQ